MTAFKIIFILFLFWASTCMSSEYRHPIDSKMDKCLSVPINYATVGMTNCIREAISDWDKELNKVYSALMNRLNDKSQKKLKTSQRAWINFKELEIKNIWSIYSHLQGTMYIPMRMLDIMNITKSRALQLDSYLSALTLDDEA